MTDDRIRAVIDECNAAAKAPTKQLAHTIDTHSCTCPSCTRRRST